MERAYRHDRGVAVTHRDLCRAAARWLISPHGRNLFAVTYEIATDGGVADALGISCPDPTADVAFRAREYQALRAVSEAKRQRRIAKAKTAPLFSSLVGADVAVEPRHLRAVDRHVAPTVAVVECKVSRADLVRDLGEQKLTRYERAASECWLFASEAIVLTSPRLTCPRLAVEQWTPEGVDSVLASLAVDGLPSNWGVVVADGRWPRTLRAAARRDVEAWEVVGWAGRIAASYSHRALGVGRMSGEVE